MRIEQRMKHDMRAFHADPALKQEMLTRLKLHAEAGEIINRANTWKDGKGGAVGCMIHDTDLAVWQERTGVPKAVGSALDVAASYLDEPEQAARFVLEWVEAVEVGQDLRSVAPALVEWLLSDGEHGIDRLAEDETVCRMVSGIADLHRRAASGDAPSETEWRAARTTALAVTDACGTSADKSIAAAAEAAAWDPAISAAVVSDTVRAWVNAFPRRVPSLVGRGAMLDREIKAWIGQLKADADKAGLPAPNISEDDLCRTHPAAVALKRAQMDEIRRAQREDRQRLAEVLLALTLQSRSRQSRSGQSRSGQSTSWQSAAAPVGA